MKIPIALLFAVVSAGRAGEDLTPSALAREGRVVHARLMKKYPGLEMDLHGGVGSPAKLVLYIPRDAWRALPDRDRVALSYFAESQIAHVRANPAAYSDIPATAPAWPMIRSAFSAICDNCWEIAGGRYVRSRRTMKVDDTLLDSTSAAALRRKLGLGGATAKSERYARPNNAAEQSATLSRDYFSATGRIWTGVRLYQATTQGIRLYGEVLGGNARYIAPDGRRVNAVKIKFSDGHAEWKERELVRDMYVRKNDQALVSQQWRTYEH